MPTRALFRQRLPSYIAAALSFGAALALSGCNSTGAVQGTSGAVPAPANSKDTSKFSHDGATETSISVDVRQYMASVISTYSTSNGLAGYMLCSNDPSTPKKCNTAFKDGHGEAELLGSQANGGGIDFVAITSWSHPTLGSCSGSDCTSPYYIGIIRSFSNSSGNGLRCFSTPGDGCGVEPPTASIEPEGVPYLIPSLPVVGLSALRNAENADHSPSGPIAGALLTTPPKNGNTYWVFGAHIWSGSPPCSGPEFQDYTTKNYIVYVKGVNFYGNIGVQDAVVIDVYSTGGTASENHVERFFYVKGYGRTRFGYAFWDPATQKYDLKSHDFPKGNYLPIQPSYFNPAAVQCPQGSFISLWP